MNNKRTWILLGGTSILGRSFAREVAKAGNDIILLGKEEEDLTLAAEDLKARYPSVSVTIEELDINNPDSFAKIAEKCETEAKNTISIFSGLEAAYTQKECGKDLGKIKNMFQVNFFSQIYFLLIFAPLLQKKKEGEILVLGSTAGEYGLSDNYAYGSTKAALHVWLQGFWAQMAQSDVTVTTVKVDDADMVGERECLPFQKPLDVDACAKACVKYAASGAKVRYFPCHASITSWLRRFVPFAHRYFGCKQK